MFMTTFRLINSHTQKLPLNTALIVICCCKAWPCNRASYCNFVVLFHDLPFFVIRREKFISPGKQAWFSKLSYLTSSIGPITARRYELKYLATCVAPNKPKNLTRRFLRNTPTNCVVHTTNSKHFIFDMTQLLKKNFFKNQISFLEIICN